MIPLDDLLLPLLAAIAVPPALLGIPLLLGRPWPERIEARLAALHSVLVFAATALVLRSWWQTPGGVHERELPTLLHLEGYHWHPTLLVDWLSALYLALIALVYPVVVRFSLPSFFREPGRSRYWFLVTLLGSALWLLCVAGNLDLLFVAWELIGVSSVLLIGFFRRQVRACQNSLRALVYYRVSDFLILLAAVSIHHSFPDQHFTGFAADRAAPHAFLVGMALLGGSLAKSAQLPMSPWLHRAMEGPAASSAIFYGALSVHLGPFLLLRTCELWSAEPLVRGAMAGVGLLTAIWATLVGRTRPDAKTALAYSTMAQIGIMYCELAAGWHTVVAVHLFAHAGLRTWQFLRSSSLIQDFQDNPVFAGSVDLQRRRFYERVLPIGLQRRLYLASVRLFWIDSLQWHWVARPFLGLFRAVERLEDACLGRPRERR
ncbi:MAG: NAD subunit H 5 [Planctomycetes bacterium]|nr:NAD subunit H 5 [Planctomycetota bacterium]